MQHVDTVAQGALAFAKAELFPRLDALANKLGIAAGHVWEVLARQAVASGVATIIAFVLSCALLVSAMFWCKQCFAWEHEDSSDGFWPFIGIVPVVGLTILVLCVSSGLPEAVAKLINPEYYALKSVLALFQR